MASSIDFVQYVCEQLSEAGTITFKRMFGEFGLYCDGTFFGTVEDNMLCLKITEPGLKLLPDAEIVEPHEGAHYIYMENLEDKALLGEVVRATCAGLPKKKPKKNKARPG